MDFSRPDNARKINRLKVLSELRKGECSRAELSRRLGINKVSIGEMVQDMVAEGLVIEGGREASGAGRPGTLVSVKSTGGRVFAFDIRARSVSVSVSDTLGRILRFERYPRDGNEEENIRRAVERISAGDGVRIYGSALVPSECGLPESLFPAPVIRIPRAIAEAEAEIAASGKLDDCLFLSWSDTFDAAICSGGNLRHLPYLAHMKAQKDGECTCGGKGCLEAAASGRVLMERTGAVSARDLARNSGYSSAIKEAMRPIAMALSEAVQALSASSVMITGDISQLPDQAYAYLQGLVSSLLPPAREVPIYRSLSGEKGTREGAAAAALNELFYRTDLLRTLAVIENPSCGL